MCGRYVAAAPPSEIAKYFGAAAPTETVLEPSYNVAPTNEVYAVVERDDERRHAAAGREGISLVGDEAAPRRVVHPRVPRCDDDHGQGLAAVLGGRPARKSTAAPRG